MADILQRARVSFSEKLNLELRLRVDEWTQGFVQLSLTPTYMDVEATEEEVQEVRLAKFSNSEQLLARNGSHTHVV